MMLPAASYLCSVTGANWLPASSRSGSVDRWAMTRPRSSYWVYVVLRRRRRWQPPRRPCRALVTAAQAPSRCTHRRVLFALARRRDERWRTSYVFSRSFARRFGRCTCRRIPTSLTTLPNASLQTPPSDSRRGRGRPDRVENLSSRPNWSYLCSVLRPSSSNVYRTRPAAS